MTDRRTDGLTWWGQKHDEHTLKKGHTYGKLTSKVRWHKTTLYCLVNAAVYYSIEKSNQKGWSTN